jgi:hypothetical protein
MKAGLWNVEVRRTATQVRSRWDEESMPPVENIPLDPALRGRRLRSSDVVETADEQVWTV